MKVNYRSLFLWTLPMAVAFGFEYFFAAFRNYNIQNFIENIVFLVCILIFISFFKATRLEVAVSKLSYFIFIFCLTIETAFFYLFSTFFSASSIFIVLETNPAEAFEFLDLYVDYTLIIFMGVELLFLLIFLLKPYQRLFTISFKIKSIYKIISLIILILGLKLSVLIIANFPFQVLKGTISYMYEVQKFSDLNLDKPFGSLKEVDFKGDTTPHTFVLIIGESTARKQMGIYDFERQTTPRLTKRKEELLIYRDVISSQAHTIPSLQEALIFKDEETQTESTIVQLMNQAGFKTFWLSNQMPIGIYETLLTKLSKASDKYVYTNTTRWSFVTPFDEVLLPHLDEALKDPATHKFIVIHLLATHSNYGLRYPKEFDVFKTEPSTAFPSEESFKVINEYHNSIFYVDFILDQIIEKTKSKDEKSYVLYFSDHGEEVYVDKNFKGHNDSDIPTKSMYEIPFFAWTSEEFDSSYTFDFDPERPYVLDDLMHSLSDFSQINFLKFDSSKSIFSKDFQPKPRIIGNKIDYDEYFKE